MLACAGRQVQYENREDARDRIIAEVVNDELVRESVAGRVWPEERIVKLVHKAAGDPFMEQWIEPATTPETPAAQAERELLVTVGGIVTRCVARVHRATGCRTKG